MTEAAPRTTHESTSDVPVINGAPDALQLARLDELVGYERRIKQQFEQEDGQSNYATFREQKVNELLAENGILDGDDESTHAEYLFAKNVYERVISLDEDEWLVREDGADRARRNAVFLQVLETYSPATDESQEAPEDEEADDRLDELPAPTETDHSDDTTDTDTTTDDSPASPETELDPNTERLLADLEAAREKWATVSAKRQGRITSIGIKDRKAIEDDYHQKANAYIAYELADFLASDTNDDEIKNVAVIQHLFNEQEALRNLTREKLQGTKLNKFVEFMNKGNLPTRIAKGVGVGVVAGFLGTVMAGAAGAGLLAGGTIAASRFVKGYAAHDKNIGTKSFEDVVDSERLQDWHDANGDHTYLDTSADYFDETFEEDTKNEQNKRRKAFAWGAGSVAVGAGLGYGIHSLIESTTDADLRLFNDGDADPSAPDVDLPDAPEWDHDGDGTRNGYDATPYGDATAHPEELDRDGDGVRNWIDADPDDSTVTGPRATPDIIDTDLDWSDFSREARWITPGEGGFQTLQEMGIPETKWEAIWQDAGTTLNEQGKTYVMDDGRWGWDHTMRLSDNDLTVIANAAERHGVTL